MGSPSEPRRYSGAAPSSNASPGRSSHSSFLNHHRELRTTERSFSYRSSMVSDGQVRLNATFLGRDGVQAVPIDELAIDGVAKPIFSQKTLSQSASLGMEPPSSAQTTLEKSVGSG